LLGGTPEDVPERYRQASPDALLPLDVPQVLLHGVDDEDVPFAMSERYAERATAAGDRVELIPLPGGHFEPVDPSTEQWDRVLEAVRRLAPP
jgi:pimeloyl-ACP methyl ester carboxylesterase